MLVTEIKEKRGHHSPQLSEKGVKGLIFETKIREKGQLEKLPDKLGDTWITGS